MRNVGRKEDTLQLKDLMQNWAGHVKQVLNEVRDQVKLGPWTCRERKEGKKEGRKRQNL